MRFVFRPLIFAMLLFSPFSWADDPRAAPTDHKEFSPNHQYFLISKVQEKRTQIFQTSKPHTVLWSISAYIQLASLSNDGRHVAASYEGGNILDLDVRPADPLITFYNATGETHVVTVNDVLPGVRSLPHSTSGRPWGRVLGFQPSGRLLVILRSEKRLELDPERH